jgi:hypothetical protein
LIEKIKVAVGQTCVNQRGSRVEEEPKLADFIWLQGARIAGRHAGKYILFGP